MDTEDIGVFLPLWKAAKSDELKLNTLVTNIMGQARLVSVIYKSRTFVCVGVISSILQVWKHKQRRAFSAVINAGQSQLRVIRNTTRKSYPTFYRDNVATSLGHHLGTP